MISMEGDTERIFGLAISTILLLVALFCWWYSKFACRKAELFAAKGKVCEQICQKMKTLQQPYRPTFYLVNAHLQIFFSHLFGNYLPKSFFRREKVVVSDGGEVSLDWFLGDETNRREEKGRNRPLLVILHGLTGGSHDALVGRLCPVAHSHGFDVVVFNRRGLSSNELKTPFLPHFSDPRDLYEVMEYLHTNHLNDEAEKRDVFAIGISAGTATLGSYLIEIGECTTLKGAVLISPSYNMENMILRYMPRLYNTLLTNNLKSMLRKHFDKFHLFDETNSELQLGGGQEEKEKKEKEEEEEGEEEEEEEKIQQLLPSYQKLQISKPLFLSDVKKALQAKTIAEFDHHIYASVYGKGNARSFYTSMDCVSLCHQIRVPTLCISAADDPVCGRKNIPFEYFEKYGLLGLVLSSYGSHCTFLEGLLGRHSWANRVAIDFLNQLRSHHLEEK